MKETMNACTIQVESGATVLALREVPVPQAAAGQVLSATDSLARRAEELSRKLENFLAEISAG